MLLMPAALLVVGSGLCGLTFCGAPVAVRRPRGARVQAGAVKERERQEVTAEELVAEVLAATAAVLDLETGMAGISLQGVTANPPWANCFVEARREEGAVFEEWVLRGERRTVEAFREWRQHSTEETSVRCVDISASEAMRVSCLECASPEGVDAPAPYVVAGLGGASQCMARTASGAAFCKSGQVVME